MFFFAASHWFSVRGCPHHNHCCSQASRHLAAASGSQAPGDLLRITYKHHQAIDFLCEPMSSSSAIQFKRPSATRVRLNLFSKTRHIGAISMSKASASSDVNLIRHYTRVRQMI
jgi:hypothetical protein